MSAFPFVAFAFSCLAFVSTLLSCCDVLESKWSFSVLLAFACALDCSLRSKIWPSSRVRPTSFPGCHLLLVCWRFCCLPPRVAESNVSFCVVGQNTRSGELRFLSIDLRSWYSRSKQCVQAGVAHTSRWMSRWTPKLSSFKNDFKNFVQMCSVKSAYIFLPGWRDCARSQKFVNTSYFVRRASVFDGIDDMHRRFVCTVSVQSTNVLVVRGVLPSAFVPPRCSPRVTESLLGACRRASFPRKLRSNSVMAVRCPGSFLAVAQTLVTRTSSKVSGKKQVRRVSS